MSRRNLLNLGGQKFDWDVQRYKVSQSGSAPATATITLDTPVPVGQSFAMVSFESEEPNGFNCLATGELTTQVGDSWTEVLVRSSNNSGFQTNYIVQVVTSEFFDVQKKVDYTLTDSSKPYSISISSIDQSKSFIVGGSSGGGSIDESTVQFSFESNTSVKIDKDTDFGEDLHYCFYVVEITISGASVDGGIVSTGDASVTQALSGEDHTFALWSWYCTNSDEANALIRGRWNSNIEFEWIRNTGNGTLSIAYFFITLPDTTCERIDHNAGDLAQDVDTDVTISSVDTSKAFVAHGSQWGSTSVNSTAQRVNAYVSQDLDNSTTLHIRRNDRDVSTDVIVGIQIVSIA